MNIINYLKHPTTLAMRIGRHWLPDNLYVRLLWNSTMKYKLNLRDPKTYNEKLQWLKLNAKNAEYTRLVDKEEVKHYVSNIIGSNYVIPTIGVYDFWDEINFDQLPNRFVIKCTHDSGGVFVCKDKQSFDFDLAKQKIEHNLGVNYFYLNREYPYKNVKPRIIIEKYIEDSLTKELRDYKFFTFEGKVKAMFIASDRGSQSETKFDFYDENGILLPFTNGHPHASPTPELPKQFTKMKELASALAKDIPHVRVDFYEADGHIYFGEMTFFHWSGIVPFEPEEWDYIFGEWLKLPSK